MTTGAINFPFSSSVHFRFQFYIHINPLFNYQEQQFFSTNYILCVNVTFINLVCMRCEFYVMCTQPKSPLLMQKPCQKYIQLVFLINYTIFKYVLYVNLTCNSHLTCKQISSSFCILHYTIKIITKFKKSNKCLQNQNFDQLYSFITMINWSVLTIHFQFFV